MTGPGTIRLGGQELPVSSFTMTMENNGRQLPGRCPRLPSGPVNVTGELTVTFQDSKLLAFFRRSHARARNRALRMARPHLGRRQFRRLRGRIKGRKA